MPAVWWFGASEREIGSVTWLNSFTLYLAETPKHRRSPSPTMNLGGIFAAVGDGVLGLLPHSQQALRRHALFRHHAEQPARRQAGIIRQSLEVVAGGKAFAQLPGIDGGHRQAQVLGHLFERNVVLPSPRTERRRKARADVARGIGFRVHRMSYADFATKGRAKSEFPGSASLMDQWQAKVPRQAGFAAGTGASSLALDAGSGPGERIIK